MTDFADQLAALREQYAQRMETVLDDLSLSVVGQSIDIAPALLANAHANLHKLAGSGGTFGFPELSLRARALEITAKAWLDAGEVSELPHWEAWKNEVSALRETLVVAGLSGVLVADVDSALPPKQASGQEKRTRVVLVDDDAQIGEELCKGLGQFGYEVSYYRLFADAEAAILADPPDVLVVDIMLHGQVPADGTQAITALFARLDYTLPTIFITSRTDFSVRLAAAKAGGDAFLTKPVDIPTLAAHIDRLHREQEIEPYRVLIVDDDEVLAEYYRLTLIAAGMSAEKVCRPQDALTAMQALHPDILLIDLYMPSCSGAQLARAIRYEDAWLGIPIIYLSAEDDFNKQINALDNGGDDFLTKPISDARLVAAVRTRAARARKVDELMSKDSLTGLLKHSSIKERMAQEYDRAQRHGKAMAIAMVDMDHFKRVNDTWGHPMGDQVIKTLAHLLRQRLRRQDSIGRYGGEEFAVVLPECDAADALRLLDDVRRRFGEIRFIHHGESFTVTLSAGVADSSQCTDVQTLLAASDAALYQAKNGGRNQVCQSIAAVNAIPQ
ncbi:MAG: diguanylate cyclase [Methylobacter sp.]|nr:diguanylate cyclase [Methylobacter sp.]